MSGPNQRPHVQAKLKGLIERASAHAESNVLHRRRPYPVGAGLRADGSKFGFALDENIGDNDALIAHVKSLLLREKAVSYVLTLPAVSEGKQYVLFSAEDEFGMLAGHQEIIMQPTPHLGPLEIIGSNVAEGRFIGLPHQP